MKKFAPNFALVIILIIGSSFRMPFERIQSISTGIDLLGSSKAYISLYLEKKEFTYEARYKNIIDYKKSMSGADFKYTVAYEKEKSSVISWDEVQIFGKEIENELNGSNFEKFRSNNNARMWGYRNIKKNLLITIQLNGAGNIISISIGALNLKLPIKK